MRRLITLLATLGILAALTTACGDEGGTASDPGTPDLDGSWVLAAGSHDGKPFVLSDGALITMLIDGDQVSGVAACNNYGGPIAITADGVKVGALAMTEMACDEPRMNLETAFLAALAAVTDADLSADSLTLTGADTTLDFDEAVVPAAAPMVGTTWHLDSLIDGDSVSSIMGEGTLTFDEQGKLTGSTGCRNFRGTWKAEGDEVTPSSLATTRQRCPADLQGQDDHVLAVLGSRFTALADGQILTITGADGLGLTYRAGK